MTYTRSGAFQRPPALPDFSNRVTDKSTHPARRGYVVTEDDLGVVRTGPKGAWWAELTPRRRDGIGIGMEVPAGRARAWNMLGVAVAAACGWGAWRVGHLGVFVGAVVALATVTLVALDRISRRNAPRVARSTVRDEAAVERDKVRTAIAARQGLGEVA